MSGYDHFTDEQLTAEIAEYRAALKTATMRPVAVIAGEGRRLEFTGKSGIEELRGELRNLVAEAQARGLLQSAGGGSLGVEIG